MRRLIERRNEERGAVNILVAILMVVLLGFAALAIDVGLMYAEKAQQQNGADAAALAIAQDCADENGCTEDFTTLAKTYANDNANDGLTNIQGVALESAVGPVTVTTGAEEVGGSENSISLLFANVLGFESAEIGAEARAAWGAPVAGITPFPVAFSICQVVEETDDLQLLVNHGDDAAEECGYGPSGHVVPGGFGLLPQEDGQCSAEINVAEEYAEGSSGNNTPPNCEEVFTSWEAQITAGDPPVELFPIFDEVDDSENPAVFNLVGFAAMEVHGWYFSGENFHNTNTHVGDAACTGSCRGIIGKFVELVSLQQGYELGPVNDDLNTTIVHLTLENDES